MSTCCTEMVNNENRTNHFVLQLDNHKNSKSVRAEPDIRTIKFSLSYEFYLLFGQFIVKYINDNCIKINSLSQR
jgi:hypothetical protein